ncbi:MAG TPA: T9SS type A sorting domain-containing protein, partial [Bacteroidetes bacterium]|nr:T9SS type A sorting domain-containing protein [Bacteroidota bacterium]
QDTIIGAIDHKFQDCNGDGTINNDDTLAINLNYGSTHTKTRHSAARGQATDPPLAMNIPQDSASVGDTLHIPITLGDSTIQANDIYGIAFSINYDASLIDSTTFHIEFAPSWIGNNTNSLNLNHNNFDIASCDGAQVRTDHQSTSGMGQIAIAHFIIIDNIDGKRQTFESKILNLNFANVLLIGLNGEKIPVDPISDSLVIYQLSTETEPIQPTSPNIQLHPNPTRDQVTITSPTAAIQEIQILNLHGQTISKTLINKRNKIKLQLANLSSGMYFIKVRTTTDLSIQRLIIR